MIFVSKLDALVECIQSKDHLHCNWHEGTGYFILVVKEVVVDAGGLSIFNQVCIFFCKVYIFQLSYFWQQLCFFWVAWFLTFRVSYLQQTGVIGFESNFAERRPFKHTLLWELLKISKKKFILIWNWTSIVFDGTTRTVRTCCTIIYGTNSFDFFKRFIVSINLFQLFFYHSQFFNTICQIFK